MTRPRPSALALALAATVLALPATAGAVGYPPLGNPGPVVKHRAGKHTTLRVCAKRGCFRTIGRAVKAAAAGDTIRVAHGTYHEGVNVLGRGKARLKLVGDPKHPGKVVLEGRGLRGIQAQNGVNINGADGVTVNGFTARHYKGNGFFAVNVDGYTLTNLIAASTGTYGVYAFNSKGGSMTNSEAYYNNDSGFYVGQTPRQARPKRTLVKNVRAWGNVLGFSGTNMRYVTITKSLWWDNGLGIVPNALKSEKYPPPEDNVIIDNQVFWNNFDYFRGAPFKLRKGATGEIAYPVGTGILLFGSRGTRVEGNQVYGNYLVGTGAVRQILLAGEKNPKLRDAAELRGNSITSNVMNLGGRDLNGRDLFYDGSGAGNCVAGNIGVLKTVPADGNTFAPCPGPTPNHFDQQAQNEAINWTVGDPTHEANWIRHPHAARGGFTPLEHCTVSHGGCRGQKKG